MGTARSLRAPTGGSGLEWGPVPRLRVTLFAIVLALLAMAGTLMWLWQAGGRADEVSANRALDGVELIAAPVTDGAPRPGLYRYRQSGHERGGIGPITIGRDLPARAPYVIRSVDGGYDEALHLADQHVEQLRLRLGPDGWRAVERRTHLTFAGIGRDDRRALAPPPLHLPQTMAIGYRWTSQYRAGDLRVVARGRVLARGTVRVEGHPHPVAIVRIVGDTEGAHFGRRIDTLWWSTAHSLALRWRIDMRLRGVVRLDAQSDLHLESLTPRT